MGFVDVSDGTPRQPPFSWLDHEGVRLREVYAARPVAESDGLAARVATHEAVFFLQHGRRVSAERVGFTLDYNCATGLGPKLPDGCPYWFLCEAGPQEDDERERDHNPRGNLAHPVREDPLESAGEWRRRRGRLSPPDHFFGFASMKQCRSYVVLRPLGMISLAGARVGRWQACPRHLCGCARASDANLYGDACSRAALVAII